jgi:shikimate kinase
VAPVLALCGFMGSGKSSVGRRVAAAQGWAFRDLDDEVVARAGMTVAQIFAAEGEERFRLREKVTLEELVSGEEARAGLVLALGGGTVTVPEVVSLLVAGQGSRAILVLHLDVDAESAWARVRGGGRPLARSRESFFELAALRGAVYRTVAERTVDAAAPLDEVAEATLAALRGWLATRGQSPLKSVAGGGEGGGSS